MSPPLPELDAPAVEEAGAVVRIVVRLSKTSGKVPVADATLTDMRVFPKLVQLLWRRGSMRVTRPQSSSTDGTFLSCENVYAKHSSEGHYHH